MVPAGKKPVPWIIFRHGVFLHLRVNREYCLTADLAVGLTIGLTVYFGVYLGIYGSSANSSVLQLSFPESVIPDDKDTARCGRAKKN